MRWWGSSRSSVLGVVDVSLLPLVVFGTVAVGVVMSIVFLISGESVYDQIGQGGMTRDSEAPPESMGAPPTESAAGRAEQEREVRQMLGARSARMVPGDSLRSTSTQRSPSCSRPPRPTGTTRASKRRCASSWRQRTNAACAQGLEPLDVAAEVQRTLAELDP